MISRDEAFILLRKYIKDQDLIRNSLAVEAILRGLANKLQKDEEIWGLVGLLHNLDYQYTSRDPGRRGTISAQILEGLLPENAINAIKANNYMYTSYIPTTSLDKSIIAAEATADFIFASIYALPSKNLSDLTLKFLIERFKDPDFGVDLSRSKIKLCEDIGFSLEEYLALTLYILKQLSFGASP